MQRGEQRVVVVDPVKGGVGEDDVDGLGQLELDQVLAQDGGALAERPRACATIDGAASTA